MKWTNLYQSCYLLIGAKDQSAAHYWSIFSWKLRNVFYAFPPPTTENSKDRIHTNIWLLLEWLLLGWLLLGWLLLGWLLLGWLLLNIFANFEQVKNYFATFEQVKKTNSKTPVRETGCLCIFFVYAIASCHRHSTLGSETYEGLHQPWALPRHLAFFCFLNA